MRPPNRVRKPHNFTPPHLTVEGHLSDGSVSSIRTNSSDSSDSSVADLLQQIAASNTDTQSCNSNPTTNRSNRDISGDSDSDFHGFKPNCLGYLA